MKLLLSNQSKIGDPFGNEVATLEIALPKAKLKANIRNDLSAATTAAIESASIISKVVSAFTTIASILL